MEFIDYVAKQEQINHYKDWSINNIKAGFNGGRIKVDVKRMVQYQKEYEENKKVHGDKIHWDKVELPYVYQLGTEVEIVFNNVIPPIKAIVTGVKYNSTRPRYDLDIIISHDETPVKTTRVHAVDSWYIHCAESVVFYPKELVNKDFKPEL